MILPKILAGSLCLVTVLAAVPAAQAAVGGPDLTFNSTGERHLDSVSANAIAVQSDGKVVVVGDGVRRLNADGSPDETFGRYGTVAGDGLTAVVVQPDGRLVVGGSAGAQAVLYRLTPEGDADPSFGTGGRVTLTTDEQVERVFALALQRDGRIVAVGSTSADAVVWRRKAYDGAADQTFNAGGQLPVNLGATEVATDVAIASDGRIVIAGNTSAHRDAFVARLDANVGLDRTFRGGGTVRFDEGGQEFATAVVVQPDAKIVVAGRTSVGGNGSVYRMLPSGAPDRTFNDAAVRFIDRGGDETIADVLLQPDGKLVLVGGTSVGGDGTLYRLGADGRLDPSFAAAVIDSGGTESLTAGALQADGAIVLAGTSDAYAMVYRRLGDREPAVTAAFAVAEPTPSPTPTPTETPTPTPAPTETPFAGSETGVAPADTTAPVITAASLTRRLIRPSGATTVRFTLSEDAATKLTIARPGRRAITLTRAHTTTGANRVNVSGRKFARGHYSITLVATDQAGNRSKPVKLGFDVVGGY